MPWRMGIRVVEAWLVARLLSSPTFHRAVRRIHGRLTGTQHHEDPPSNLDTGHSGTELEGPRRGGPIEFMKIYIDELKNEFKRK